jgi:hypothetical protein
VISVFLVPKISFLLDMLLQLNACIAPVSPHGAVTACEKLGNFNISIITVKEHHEDLLLTLIEQFFDRFMKVNPILSRNWLFVSAMVPD